LAIILLARASSRKRTNISTITTTIPPTIEVGAGH
jgi:hypothetical protein